MSKSLAKDVGRLEEQMRQLQAIGDQMLRNAQQVQQQMAALEKRLATIADERKEGDANLWQEIKALKEPKPVIDLTQKIHADHARSVMAGETGNANG